MRITKFISVFVLAAVLFSCSEYNEVLKSDDYKKKFVMANDLYKEGVTPTLGKNGKVKKQYQDTPLERSIALNEQIYQTSPKSGEGELAYFRIGKAYYYTGDYYMAGYFLGMFPKRFPLSPKAEESLFLSALCSVKNSPKHTLDQYETELAITDLQKFIDQFPNSDLIDSCNNTIDRLRYKLELKEFESVKLYAKTENFRAAVSSGLTFNEDYPVSVHAEEVQYIIVKNSYLYAMNSVDTKKVARLKETIERYSIFVALFPDSEYSKELKGYEEMADKELNGNK